MAETTNKYVGPGPAVKQFNAALSSVVEHAATSGLPVVIMADQVLCVAMHMMLDFVTLGGEEWYVEGWETSAYAALNAPASKEWTLPVITLSKTRDAAGDRVSPFAEIAALEISKREMREALLKLAADTRGELFHQQICGILLDLACHLGTRPEVTTSHAWSKHVEDAMRRFRQGELRSEEVLLRVVADRNLNSGARPLAE